MIRPLIISGGEPAGIAPEIIAASWQYFREKDQIFAVIGDAELFTKRTGVPTVKISDIDQTEHFFRDSLPVLDRPFPHQVVAGIPNKANAQPVIQAISDAVQLCHSGAASAMITAPIDKNILNSSGFTFQGHTDYLQQLDTDFHGKAVQSIMMLASKTLRCVPVTVHVSLKQAVETLTTQGITDCIQIVADALQKRWHIPNPSIAISGLNPHAGEQGQMGYEEQDLINPPIETLRKKRPDITLTNALPADSLFTPFMRESYDAFICMTHDQALIPIKTLHFDEAVNITLGLSFIRTSPDHGTAYDLSGTDKASPNSMITAIQEAWRMAQI